MDELIAFLNARLDDDEATARAASRAPWRVDIDLPMGTVRDAEGVRLVSSFEDAEFLLADAEHIVRHDPARVLADVAAKRAIVKRADWAWAGVFEGAARGKLERAALYRRVLGYLAQPYADHPDFRKEWVLR